MNDKIKSPWIGDEEVKRIITKIEPLIILALSMVIGFVMLSIYLPIFDIMKMIRQ